MDLERTDIEHTRDRGGLTTDEKFSFLFQPDTLLPAQYYGNLRRTTLTQPETRLTLAILEDAINCYQENVEADSGKRKRLFVEAEEWILDDGGDWIFSFRNVCEILGVSPAYVRQGLLRWKQERARAHRAAWREGKPAA